MANFCIFFFSKFIMSGITGLEVLFATIKNDLKLKEDCAVAAIHWLLIRSDLLCLGVGDVFSDNDVDAATELLPENWNKKDPYVLRYCCKDLKNRHLLKIAKTGGNLHVNFAVNEDTLTATTIAVDDFVSDDFTNFPQAYKKLNELKSQIKKDIVKVLVSAKKKPNSPAEEEATKKKASPKDEPIQEPPQANIPEQRPIPIGIPDSRHPVPFPYPQIGASDLDPLGRSSGGMLFDPFGPGAPVGPGFGGNRGGRFGGGRTGLPPGAVPPGARFDPFSPVYPDRFNPNPDHYRPPDYDNMFM